MAIITQFDTDPVLIVMRDKHHAWHTFPGGAHGYPSRTFKEGTPGSGHEFLQFHSDLMNQFFAWNAVYHGASASDLAAWTAVPSELKLPETGWPVPAGFGGVNLADAEARINSNVPPFASDDALGIHIETTIHDWIHGAVAASSIFALSPAEKEIIRFFHSVQSTYFYKIHGLVQFWWNRWLHPKSHIKEIIDVPKAQAKEVIDVVKSHFKEIIDTGPIKQIKDKDKDIVESKVAADVVDPFRPQGDPALIKNLIDQVALLQKQAGVKQSPFIQPFMRPMVGESIVKKDKPKKK
jgi:hypothetical protein